MPLPTDPLLATQWHLNQMVSGLLDLNVLGVWNPAEGLSYTGAGTRTVVIDGGFDYNHQDFDNYDQSLDYDLYSDTQDPFGAASDEHGTAVAGIIGAAADGTGAVGVAFDTSLVGYRVTVGIWGINGAWLGDISDAIAGAATRARADVANISLSISNDRASEFGLGYGSWRFDNIEASIATAVDTGRGGLGMTIVKAAGNSRIEQYDVNADDWTNDTRQVVVAAVDQDGFFSWYSSYGAAVLVSGFGTPGQVVTTDRTGAAGYNGTDFTTTFSGTSAAAPMVSGVVALMYEANAGLGWRDVQSILGVSARQVGIEVDSHVIPTGTYAWGWNGADTWNGGGAHFNNDYGYGLVDALAAVRLAETWLLTGTAAAVTSNQSSNTMDVLNVRNWIPDGNDIGRTFSGTAISNDTVERVTVEMAFSTTATGNMEVYLTSPSGMISLLIDNAGQDTDYNRTWTFESQAFRGERAAGLWTVRVIDTISRDWLTVTDIVIRTFGDTSADDRYVFTNEYSDYAVVGGHATAVNDSNFGTDTVNAAAVSSASIIRLDGVAGTIDGVGVSFTNIEHAIGGDGGDQIFGSTAGNQLHGMRGADSLFGGDGTDSLYGGDGDDVLDGGGSEDSSFGGAGNDRFVISDDSIGDNISGGADGDTLDLSGWTDASSSWIVNLQAGFVEVVVIGLGNAGIYSIDTVENVAGSNFNDSLTGDGLDNNLSGVGGSDAMFGGDGSDSLFGGDGSDTINGDSGIDSLFGGDGDDVLYGGSSVDSSFGGAGHDRFVFNDGNLGDNVSGGADSDTLDLSSWTDASTRWNVNLQTGVVERVLIDFGTVAIYSIATVENVIGSNFNDSLTGDGLANSLSGGLGIDTLFGGGGIDALFGGDGDDVLNGGSSKDSSFGGGGNDRFVISGIDFGDNVSGGADNDTLDLSSWTDAAISWNVNLQTGLVERVPNGFKADGIYSIDTVENVTGSNFNDSLTGDGLANSLSGGGGSDTINGGDGIDTLFGGSAIDALFGGDGDDVLDGGSSKDSSFGGAGNDRFVISGIDFGDNVSGGADNDTLDLSSWTDAAISWNVNLQTGLVERVPNGFKADGIYSIDTVENVTGSNFNDSLTGDGLANNLSGGGGGDTINGGDGIDTLFGGSGIDALFGGDGDDVLDGGGSEDSSFGGAGNDRFVISGVYFGDNVSGGADSDTLDLSSWTDASTGWNVNLQTGVVELVPNGFGTDGIYSIDTVENVTGSDFNDSLTGDGLANSLSGGLGSDTINGGSGIDTLFGGAGNDTYVTEGGDVITEGKSEGTDLVQSAVSLTLEFNLENLTLTGAAAINGTGNTLANLITGNAANNVLNGGIGADTLAGGKGADTLVGGAGNDTYVTDSGDVITEGKSEGTDLVQSAVSLTLGSNLENLTLTGAAAINGTGNTLANLITGNAGNNVLNGGKGADTLAGFGGADAFVFNTSLGAGNVDRITDFNVVDDTIQLANAIFTGLANGVLTAAAFLANTAGLAGDASDRIIYDTGTGNIFFDADGTGGGARVQFAVLNPGLSLTSADFFVF